MFDSAKSGTASGPKWKPPTAVAVGDELVYFSHATHFTFRVESIQHDGAWLFGRDVRDGPHTALGPVAVSLAHCMTPAQASVVLQGMTLHNSGMCDADDTLMTKENM